jgi:hypothetical protein
MIASSSVSAFRSRRSRIARAAPTAATEHRHRLATHKMTRIEILADTRLKLAQVDVEARSKVG